MCFTWHGAVRTEEVVNLGPLALLDPLLERMQVADIIDRHLPPDPQLEFSHGQVLSLLLAARLSSPTALVNVPAWAEKTGADILWNIPADKLNDDRLGRALDAFFTERHSILACVAEQVLRTANVPRDCLHFDPTHLLFYGAYDSSQPRPNNLPLPPETPSADFPPAHITYGYGASDVKLVQAGVTAVVDEHGALPVFSHLLDGNRNGHPAMQQQFELLQHYLPPVYHFDAATAEADAVYDGYSALVTTAPCSRSADVLFTQFKQQNYLELLHHQWKTPLAVRPVFLKSPQRVEALFCLLQLALTAYQLLERLYRQKVSADDPVTEQRMTTESLLRQFRVYGLIVRRSPVGRVVYATRLTSRQRHILGKLGFATPARILTRKLRPPPFG